MGRERSWVICTTPLVSVSTPYERTPRKSMRTGRSIARARSAANTKLPLRTQTSTSVLPAYSRVISAPSSRTREAMASAEIKGRSRSVIGALLARDEGDARRVYRSVGRRLYLERSAVGRDRDCPVAIGPPDPRPGGCKRGHGQWMGVTEAIAPPDRDDGFGGRDGRKERGRRRRRAPVVAHLEDVRSQARRVSREQLLFFFALCIPHEEQRPRAIGDAKDEGVVVGISIGR